MAREFGNEIQQVQGIGGAGPSPLSGLGLSPEILSASGLTGNSSDPLSALGLPGGGSTLSPLSQGAGQGGGTTQQMVLLLEEILQMLENQGAAGSSGNGGVGGSGGLPANALNTLGPGNTSAAGSAGGIGGSPGGSAGPLTSAVGNQPANAQAMYKYFTSHGLSHNAAAGIIGNIAQESGGNPESVGSGGNGLIGWTPPLAGAVTGNPQRDLQFQLDATMKYISQNGSVADINAHASSPAAAAAYFMSKYERPAPATENAPHRESAANAVANKFA